MWSPAEIDPISESSITTNASLSELPVADTEAGVELVSKVPLVLSVTPVWNLTINLAVGPLAVVLIVTTPKDSVATIVESTAFSRLTTWDAVIGDALNETVVN